MKVLGSVNKTTVCSRASTNYTKGIDITSDKVFLLSQTEVAGGNNQSPYNGQSYAEGQTYSLYTGTDAERIMYQNGTSKSYWLRSIYKEGQGSCPKYITTSGTIQGGYYGPYPTASYCVALAVCIV